MEITDTDRLNFLNKLMGKIDTRTRYRESSSAPEEEFMLTFLDTDDDYKMITSTDIRNVIDKAIIKRESANSASSVDHIPHSL